MPSTDRAATQPRAEIEAAHERVRARLDEVVARGYSGEAYTRGQLAAVAWVLGEAAESPLSGQSGADVSAARVIDSEWALSERMLTREIPMDRRGQSYVVGVEHALMWVLHQTDTPLP
jgi:hypothetical protein